MFKNIRNIITIFDIDGEKLKYYEITDIIKNEI